LREFRGRKIFTQKTVTVETDGLDKLQKVLGVFDENLTAIARELELVYRVEGTAIVLDGEEANTALGQEVLKNLLSIVEAGENIDKSSLSYCIELAREGRAEDIGGIMKDVVAVTSRGKPVKCKTAGQKDYVAAIKRNTVTFGTGPAGTGKTYLAVCLAVAAYKGKQVEKIILTRPAVEAGEKLGFLPGDLQTKVDPYLRPLYDALQEMFGQETYMKLMEKGVIEVAPLAYMRGRTLSASFVILDEAQNATREQMKMFLTRLGEGSKMVITGDLTQTDLPDGKTSGLKQAVQLLKGVEDIAVCALSERDVVRHPLVTRIVRAYEKDAAKRSKGEKS
jgi:phosphate starvation-inducible PhoH-like protein